MYVTIDGRTKKKNYNRRTALERSIGKLLEKGGLKLVLFMQNLTLNSDADPNYKYMFGPHRRHLPHL